MKESLMTWIRGILFFTIYIGGSMGLVYVCFLISPDYPEHSKEDIPKDPTPRDKNTDLLYSEDSIYYIHYTIDSTEERNDYEQQERN